MDAAGEAVAGAKGQLAGKIGKAHFSFIKKIGFIFLTPTEMYHNKEVTDEIHW